MLIELCNVFGPGGSSSDKSNTLLCVQYLKKVPRLQRYKAQ